MLLYQALSPNISTLQSRMMAEQPLDRHTQFLVKLVLHFSEFLATQLAMPTTITTIPGF
jgi:hypothetical protein